MLQFGRPTAQDLKAEAAIERKRRLEEERKARIFNPRIRKIGIDKEFLEKQVQERTQRQNSEKQLEWRQAEALINSSKLAMSLQMQLEESVRKKNQQIDEYRKSCQRMDQRRDFDLYDPDGLKKSKPLRDPDEDDEKIGIASAQKFEGEDLNMKNRLKAQKEQMQCWIMQQLRERKLAEQSRRDQDEASDASFLSRSRRALELQRMENECRKKLDTAIAKFNLALAEQRERDRRDQEAKDEADKKAEIYNHVTGDFLTESREQAQSNMGPCRPLVHRYKGMSLEELQAIIKERERQMEELKRMRKDEEAKIKQWDNDMISNAKTAAKCQQELERRRGQLSKKIAEENLQLAQEQKSNQEFLNKHLYKYKPSPEFYQQFNTTTR